MPDEFEKITRLMRWFVIVVVVISFPFTVPQAYNLYILAVIASVYNLTRYSQALMRLKWYASTVMMLAVDNIFLLALIALAGDVVTPYTAFLIYTVIAASYCYKLTGTLVLIGLQLIFLAVINEYGWYPTITLSAWGTILLVAAIPLGVGLFVERLTRLERGEKDILRRLSQDLEAGQKHLMTLIDSLGDAIFVVSSDGVIQQYNTAGQSISVVEGDLKGKVFSVAVPLYNRSNPDSDPVDVLKESGPQRRRDLLAKTIKGANIDLDISVTPVRIEGRQTTDFVVVCKDITRERSIDEERTDFISVVSHELRTPISIIEAELSVIKLKSDKLDSQTRDLITQAHDQSLQLGSIIKDLSMMSEANNDNLPVKFDQIDPAALLRQMAADFETQAAHKGLKIDVEISGEVPVVLSTRTHIIEILQNYLTNALKYSKEGTISLKAEPSDSGGVILSVHDTGIGISPADQKHLFKKFFRSEDFRTRETGGTGLGLYLCMELATRLNGKVWCQSELNEGSTFYLEIPPASRLRRDQKEVVEAEVASLVESI